MVVALVANYDPARLADRGHDRSPVQRLQGPWIEDLSLEAILPRQDLGSL
jgi:hypothetical protein